MPVSGATDDLSSIVLDHIPANGTTMAQLFDNIKGDPTRVMAAVGRLLDLQLVEFAGDVIRKTSADDLSPIVFDHIPPDGTTLAQLSEEIRADPARINAAVKRLQDLRLVEVNGDAISSTPFARKARGFFKFTA